MRCISWKQKNQRKQIQKGYIHIAELSDQGIRTAIVSMSKMFFNMKEKINTEKNESIFKEPIESFRDEK